MIDDLDLVERISARVRDRFDESFLVTPVDLKCALHGMPDTLTVSVLTEIASWIDYQRRITVRSIEQTPREHWDSFTHLAHGLCARDARRVEVLHEAV